MRTNNSYCLYRGQEPTGSRQRVKPVNTFADRAATTASSGGGSGGERTTYLDYVLSNLTRTQLPFLSRLQDQPGDGSVEQNSENDGDAADAAAACVLVEGQARHLGMPCEWTQRFHLKTGAFFEELKNEDMHVWWGFDGKDTTWEVDFSGLPSVLELDDRETSLLCTWIRNGCWLVPEIRNERLRIKLAEDEEEPEDWGLLREQSFGRAAAAAGEEASTSGTPAEGKGAGRGRNTATLEVTLADGKVTARLEVCTDTWRPLDLTLPVCGDIEKTTYTDFVQMGPDGAVCYPKHTVQVASGGGKNEYWAERCEVERGAAMTAGAERFEVPEVPLFPPDTSFDPSAGGEFEYVQARSGHIVVKPKINGEAIPGMMILDTGASGFVITKQLADSLALDAFGELYVAGVTQKVRSQFRRAKTIQLGPVRMKDPLFMEMSIDGVVHGSPEPIVGILGYDFFRRCVVEMPPHQQQPVMRSGLVPSSYLPKPPRMTIKVHDPNEYEGEEGAVWRDLQLVANVPHIHATFRKDGKDGDEHSALFMLDSGAGGAGVMFHARASQEYELLDQSQLRRLESNTKSIRGIGGEASAEGMKVIEGQVRYLHVSGARFENVLSLIAMGGGFDLSLHTAGMICADLMTQCRVVFDYPRRRFAMIQED